MTTLEKKAKTVTTFHNRDLRNFIGMVRIFPVSYKQLFSALPLNCEQL